jgi:hypothetical protein
VLQLHNSVRTNTQYILNNYILNPALSGIENYTDLKNKRQGSMGKFCGRPKQLI